MIGFCKWGLCASWTRTKHPKFTGGVSRIHHVSFVVGEESGRAGLKLEIDSGTYDPEANDLGSDIPRNWMMHYLALPHLINSLNIGNHVDLQSNTYSI